MKNLYKKTLSLGLSILCLCFAISASAQDVTLHFKAAPLQKVIDAVSKQSKFNFLFDAEFLKKANPVTIDADRMSVQKVLPLIFAGQPFNYKITGKSIILTQKVSSRNVTEDEIIHGMVTDSLGAGLPGVSVLLKGTSIAGQTDATGHFLLRNTGANKTVIVRYMGYRSQEVTANGSENLNIKLQMESYGLNDVVVNGFQNVSRERSTSAITQINNEQLNKQINVDLLSALEGQVPGLLYIKNPTGSSADRPVLRGIASYQPTTTSSPLIVIDGLPTEFTMDQVNPYDIESISVLRDGAASSIYGSRSAFGVIVLTTKQAKGSGVKISANADFFLTAKPDFSKMHYASTSDLIDYETDLYNYEKSRAGSATALFNSYGDIGGSTIKYYSPLYQLYRQQEAGTLSATQVNNTLSQWRNNDYLRDYRDNVWQNELRKRYNLSLSSATKTNNTYMSLNYDESQERVKNNQGKSLNLYFKSTYNLKKWLTATFGFNGTYTQDQSTELEYSDYNLQPRYAQIVDANGNRVVADYINLKDGFTSSGEMNAVAALKLKAIPDFKPVTFNILDELEKGLTTQKNLKLRGFADIKVDLFKGLSYDAKIQYENSRRDVETYNEADSYKMRYAYNVLTVYNTSTAKYTHPIIDGGRFRQLSQQSWNYTFRQQLSFDRLFGNTGNEHSIAAIAGFELRETTTPRSIEQMRYGYDPQTLTSAAYDAYTMSQTGVVSYIYSANKTLGALANSQSSLKHRFVSAYSNLSYTFRGKYVATGSIRVDQADLFGLDPKYQYRPLWSAGLAWNASSEDFLKKYDWLSMLKFRATYGINGNAELASSTYLVSRIRNDNLYPALQYTDIVSYPNPKLRWEKSATLNFGMDYALLNNRLRGSIDMYTKKSTDLLVPSSLDPTVGVASIDINNGAITNRGVEIAIGGDWLKRKDLTLTSNFVIAFNKSEIVKVTRTVTDAYSAITSPTSYFFLNTPLNTMYAYKYGGMVNGYPYFLDEKGESNVVFDATGTPTSIKSITNPDALVNLGTLTPTYTGSFNQRVSYKEFSLGAMLVFSGGNKLRKDVTNIGATTVTDEDLTRRWKSGLETDLPRLLIDYPQNLSTSASTLASLWQYSDKQVLDATYIKLRNVSLSYSLPKSVNNLIKVSSARITAQVNNLWYWSKAGDDIDPETYSLNSGTRSLQTPKSFLIGLNVNF
ncbi:SusC/RagA family TonB-linked outer membrane protein [Pedobacter sp. MC2016-14]|uniref:SusC/RagA family TonB-linked outer membrane protein n=1 Tax=Pedobacter sp. MC2016-14 TaxID=2897327 RepID=UPI001E48F401|nr:SusC/RagA family TonB-linked outer membrane protein [Pedobacter sp. MC2016-14]MCD0487658.1 SusC/RagA family TonB-linked outer membrane protein [Pedobacter sp. MC2016-14]